MGGGRQDGSELGPGEGSSFTVQCKGGSMRVGEQIWMSATFQNSALFPSFGRGGLSSGHQT